VFELDRVPNLVVLSTDPRVLLVTMCVEFGESPEALVRLTVVDEPSGNAVSQRPRFDVFG